ncbi:MAG: ribosomal protein S18-alanine N-acetyltransferase [Oscillospiraceae bacterium]
MTVRRAALEDIPAIMDIERASFSIPWSEHSVMFEFESADAAVLVADDGELEGFAILHRFCDDGELFNIAVREGCRGRGIGRKLLKAVLDSAREMGIRRIYLEVRKSNAAARRLYEKLGFAVCGERRNYYDAPKEDAILMDAEV